MSAVNIPGINADVGLDLYDGEMDIYMAILQSFAENTPEAIDKLRNVTMDNLYAYGICVHGLKSVSASIGALDFSAKAKLLELMAKEGDLIGILAKNDELIREAQTLVDNITTWLKTADVGTQDE
jgi:HPt (histidine-containing phosphotransfer) domain-containing protein